MFAMVSTLGISFLISLAISLWTAISSVKAIFDALNFVYEEEEKRSFVKLNALALLFTLGIIGFILLMLATAVALPIALNFIPVPGLTTFLVKVGRWPIVFVLLTLGLEVLYRYGPAARSRDGAG
jgi:membrane protein